MSKEKIGTIHPKGSMFLRMHCGEATDAGKVEYEMATAINSGSPLIYCIKRVKHFSISWQELVELAEKQGIAE